MSGCVECVASGDIYGSLSPPSAMSTATYLPEFSSGEFGENPRSHVTSREAMTPRGTVRGALTYQRSSLVKQQLESKWQSIGYSPRPSNGSLQSPAQMKPLKVRLEPTQSSLPNPVCSHRQSLLSLESSEALHDDLGMHQMAYGKHSLSLRKHGLPKRGAGTGDLSSSPSTPSCNASSRRRQCVSFSEAVLMRDEEKQLCKFLLDMVRPAFAFSSIEKSGVRGQALLAQPYRTDDEFVVKVVGLPLLGVDKTLPGESSATPKSSERLKELRKLSHKHLAGVVDVYTVSQATRTSPLPESPRCVDVFLYVRRHIQKSRSLQTLMNGNTSNAAMYSLLGGPFASKGAVPCYRGIGMLPPPYDGLASETDVLANIIWEMASGLHYLHRRHLIHGNLTPTNVLLTYNQRVYLTDFGLPSLPLPLMESDVLVEEEPTGNAGREARLRLYKRASEVPASCTAHRWYLVKQYSHAMEAEDSDASSLAIRRHFFAPECVLSTATPAGEEQLWVSESKRSPASDVYAFGVLSHLLLTGCFPTPPSCCKATYVGESHFTVVANTSRHRDPSVALSTSRPVVPSRATSLGTPSHGASSDKGDSTDQMPCQTNSLSTPMQASLVELLNGILHADPSMRWTVQQVRQHVFFRQYGWKRFSLQERYEGRRRSASQSTPSPRMIVHPVVSPPSRRLGVPSLSTPVHSASGGRDPINLSTSPSLSDGRSHRKQPSTRITLSSEARKVGPSKPRMMRFLSDATPQHTPFTSRSFSVTSPPSTRLSHFNLHSSAGS